MAAEPSPAKWFQPFDSHADFARRHEEPEHISELTLALEAEQWFSRRGVNDCR